MYVYFSPLNTAILFRVHTATPLLVWQRKLRGDPIGWSWTFLPITGVQNPGSLLLLMRFQQIPVGSCLTLILCSSILVPFIRWIAFTHSIYIWSIYKYCKREEMFGRKNNSYLATGKRQQRFWLQQSSLKVVMERKRSLPSSSLGVNWKSENKHKETPHQWMTRACYCPCTVVCEIACSSTPILSTLTK